MNKYTVSVICPIYNERKNIKNFLLSLTEQDYTIDLLEYIFVDGNSSDGTLELLNEFTRSTTLKTKILFNPKKFVSYAMNIGIKNSISDIIIRMDSRCIHPKNYISKLVYLLSSTGAINVGGTLFTKHNNKYVSKSIALSYKSPVSVGDALKVNNKNTNTNLKEVDAVYGGCWFRHTLKKNLFDTRLVRNQDDELSFRLRSKGGKIIKCPDIQVSYYVRDNYLPLLKQYFQYGYWKLFLFLKYTKQCSLRHIIPSLFVILILSSIFINIYIPFLILLVYILANISIVTYNKVCNIYHLPGVLFSLFIIHVGYGTGFIFGFLLNILGLYFYKNRFNSKHHIDYKL